MRVIRPEGRWIPERPIVALSLERALARAVIDHDPPRPATAALAPAAGRGVVCSVRPIAVAGGGWR